MHVYGHKSLDFPAPCILHVLLFRKIIIGIFKKTKKQSKKATLRKHSLTRRYTLSDALSFNLFLSRARNIFKKNISF
jgi:hypothetical protein